LHAARDAAAGVRVPFDVELSWEEASRLLTESFGGKRYQNVALESLRLMPGKDGKIVVEASVDYRGGGLKKYHGLVYLEGMPRFDAEKSALALDNLEYSLDPKRHNPFVRIGDRLAHEALRARLAAPAGRHSGKHSPLTQPSATLSPLRGARDLQWLLPPNLLEERLARHRASEEPLHQLARGLLAAAGEDHLAEAAAGLAVHDVAA